MRVKKAIVLCLLALLVVNVCLGQIPVHAAGASKIGKCGENATWLLSENGTLTISGTGLMEGFEADSGLWDDFAVRRIIINEGITGIRTNAFKGLTSLTSVVLPNSLTSIGSGAFQNCALLTEIVIPHGVTEILGYTFKGCTSLTSVVIPDSVTTIWASVFEGCTSLTYVSMPSSVTKIGRGAFKDCPNLWHVLYQGRKGQFKDIYIQKDNDALKDADKHYHCSGNERINAVEKTCSVCRRNTVIAVLICAAVGVGVGVTIVVFFRRKNRIW